MALPNILIVTTDQQHHAMMSCSGNRWLATPGMDRLARTGVRFVHACCSNPACAPSRFSWWTGRMPSAIGVRSNEDVVRELPHEVHATALGHVMESAGYRSLFAGKVHLPGDLTPRSMGFEYLCDDERDRLAVEAAAFVRSHERRPWILAVNFINPHDICYLAIRELASTDNERRLIEHGAVECEEVDRTLAAAPPGGNEQLATQYPPLPDNAAPQADEPEIIQELFAEWPFRGRARESWDEWKWRRHRWVYHRLTERVDAQIAVVLDALASGGGAAGTVVIFTSDHGDQDGAHGLEHKLVPYDEAVRVPFIVSDPAGRSGMVDSSHIVQTGIDLMATCCDYAGVPAPQHCLGLSVRPVVTGGSVGGWRDGTLIETQIGDAYYTTEAKYVRYHHGAHSEQLYDKRTDPGETRNALADPQCAQIVGRCRNGMAEEIERHARVRVV